MVFEPEHQLSVEPSTTAANEEYENIDSLQQQAGTDVDQELSESGDVAPHLSWLGKELAELLNLDPPIQKQLEKTHHLKCEEQCKDGVHGLTKELLSPQSQESQNRMPKICGP